MELKRFTSWLKGGPYIIVGAIITALVLSLLLFLPSGAEPPDEVTREPKRKITRYATPESLMSQELKDCLEVQKPKGKVLRNLLPAGEYRRLQDKYALNIKTEAMLNARIDGQIDACTGVDYLYDVRPLLEQLCQCTLRVKCSC